MNYISKIKCIFTSIIAHTKKTIRDAEANDYQLASLYPQYAIGRGTYAGATFRIIDHSEGSTLTIGSYCSFADNVLIMLGANHRTDWITTYPFTHFLDKYRAISGHPASKGNVVIGSDVWIGCNVIILSGVSIGHGAVVGAGSVVTKNIGNYEVFAGCPAKYIKKRFDDNVIDALVKSEWWNWPVEEVEACVPLLCSSNYKDFVKYIAARK